VLATAGDSARSADRAGDDCRRGLLIDFRYRFGPPAEAAFLRSFARGELVVGNLVDEDFERMAQLVEQYDSFPLGGSDASVIAIAERRSITTILTTDRRHFAAVRPRHVDAFELLP
jgi:predicted nucleic acid-binding protein